MTAEAPEHMQMVGALDLQHSLPAAFAVRSGDHAAVPGVGSYTSRASSSVLTST